MQYINIFKPFKSVQKQDSVQAETAQNRNVQKLDEMGLVKQFQVLRAESFDEQNTLKAWFINMINFEKIVN